MDRSLRWALLVPAAILSWVVVFLFSAWLLIEFGDYCSQQGGKSIFCGRLGLDLAIFFGSAFSAVAVVSTSVFVAPSNKRRVAWYSYLAGAVVATVLQIGGDSFQLPYLGALGFGLIAVIVLQSRLRNADAA